MLRRIRVDKFKSVSEPIELEMAPLTLVAGPNSSGKSTLLQSILLLTQTVSSKATSRPVVLNGPTVRLGTFHDVLTHGAKRRAFSLGFDLVPSRPIHLTRSTRPRSHSSGSRLPRSAGLSQISVDVAFRGRARQASAIQGSDDQPITVASLDVVATYVDDEGAERQAKLRARPSRLKYIEELKDDLGVDELTPTLRAAANLRPVLDASSKRHLQARYSTAEAVGTMVEHFLPRRIAVKVNRGIEAAGRAVETVLQIGAGSGAPGLDTVPFRPSLIAALERTLDDTLKARLVDSSEPLTPIAWRERVARLTPKDRAGLREKLRGESNALIQAAFREPIGAPQEYDVRFEALPEGLEDGSYYADDYFSRFVRYLGPLRDEPRPVYPLSTSADVADVGTKGEFTAAVLDLNRDQQVTYLSPENVAAGIYDAKLTTKPLIDAVEEWIQYMGVSKGVFTRDLGSQGHEIRVRSDTARHLDLTQVGVGVSQVLPIIVLGLVAGQESLVIFEQPELHLHPKVQTLLGDFFVSMIHSDLQCLVETHSEYLINRIRFRTASAETNLHEKVRIYFTESSGAGSGYRQVQLNEYGGIVDWPSGFFDETQAQAEAILRAGLAKRKGRRGDGARSTRD